MRKPAYKTNFQGQISLFPTRLDQIIAEYSLFRLVNQIVDDLDITAIEKTYSGGNTSAYYPRIMLKILFYAYMNNIYSCRKIGKQLLENVHYIWLSGKETSDFRTINNFRSLHLKGPINHGIPVNLDPGVYTDLAAGALEGYQVTNMDDKDFYYYKRVYLGCVRAIDFIESLDCFDGKNIGVTGGSQGGALSIITAGLDSRIDYLAAFYPALSDLTGYLNERAGGWPHMFRNAFTNKSEKVQTSKYYDVVNFARFVKVPGWYSWGYNDNVCPPTSMHAAYNVIPGEKELHIFQETQHWTFPEQNELKNNWLYDRLKK